MTDIEKTEAEIKVLQTKLELLKEIETHKSQPRMNFELGGKFEIVSYNGENYYRLEFDDESHSWYKRREKLDGNLLKQITDGETHRLLEGVWFNDVKKGKYDDEVAEPSIPSMINCVLEGNPPNGYSYWNEWYKELGSKGILHNLKLSSIDNKTTEPYCPDEPEHYDEVEWDEKDNPKPMDEVVDKLIKEQQAQTLYNRLYDELGYDFNTYIVDLVEDWLPEEHDTNSDGWNKCVRMLREKLR